MQPAAMMSLRHVEVTRAQDRERNASGDRMGPSTFQTIPEGSGDRMGPSTFQTIPEGSGDRISVCDASRATSMHAPGRTSQRLPDSTPHAHVAMRETWGVFGGAGAAIVDVKRCVGVPVALPVNASPALADGDEQQRRIEHEGQTDGVEDESSGYGAKVPTDQPEEQLAAVRGGDHHLSALFPHRWRYPHGRAAVLDFFGLFGAGHCAHVRLLRAVGRGDQYLGRHDRVGVGHSHAAAYRVGLSDRVAGHAVRLAGGAIGVAQCARRHLRGRSSGAQRRRQRHGEAVRQIHLPPHLQGPRLYPRRRSGASVLLRGAGGAVGHYWRDGADRVVGTGLGHRTRSPRLRIVAPHAHRESQRGLPVSGAGVFVRHAGLVARGAYSVLSAERGVWLWLAGLRGRPVRGHLHDHVRPSAELGTAVPVTAAGTDAGQPVHHTVLDAVAVPDHLSHRRHLAVVAAVCRSGPRLDDLLRAYHGDGVLVRVRGQLVGTQLPHREVHGRRQSGDDGRLLLHDQRGRSLRGHHRRRRPVHFCEQQQGLFTIFLRDNQGGFQCGRCIRYGVDDASTPTDTRKDATAADKPSVESDLDKDVEKAQSEAAVNKERADSSKIVEITVRKHVAHHVVYVAAISAARLSGRRRHPPRRHLVLQTPIPAGVASQRLPLQGLTTHSALCKPRLSSVSSLPQAFAPPLPGDPATDSLLPALRIDATAWLPTAAPGRRAGPAGIADGGAAAAAATTAGGCGHRPGRRDVFRTEKFAAFHPGVCAAVGIGAAERPLVAHAARCGLGGHAEARLVFGRDTAPGAPRRGRQRVRRLASGDTGYATAVGGGGRAGRHRSRNPVGTGAGDRATETGGGGGGGGGGGAARRGARRRCRGVAAHSERQLGGYGRHRVGIVGAPVAPRVAGDAAAGVLFAHDAVGRDLPAVPTAVVGVGRSAGARRRAVPPGDRCAGGDAHRRGAGAAAGW
eukprot:ctg_1254.g273